MTNWPGDDDTEIRVQRWPIWKCLVLAAPIVIIAWAGIWHIGQTLWWLLS